MLAIVLERNVNSLIEWKREDGLTLRLHEANGKETLCT